MKLPITPNTEFITQDDITYMIFKPWKHETHMGHCFTTRFGGVSTGDLTSLNLGFNRGDSLENVLENYKRVGAVLSVDAEKMVLSNQVHETIIQEVSQEDCGNGISRPNKWESVDGIYTSKKNVPLVTHYADCVPLFFYAPEYHMIGMAHAGWRGTVNEIGCKMVHKWHEEHGIPYDKIQIAIGPSIGPCCFEVHDDVANVFKEKFNEQPFITKSKAPGKYHINLWACNAASLINSGIKEENIYSADICTCCYSDLFFSHRKTQGKRGTLGAFMVLR